MIKYLDETKVTSLKEFFECIDSDERSLISAGKQKVEIAEFKEKFTAFLFTTGDYINRREQNPEWYPEYSGAECLEQAKLIYPYLLDIYSYLLSCEDGDLLVEKIDTLITVALIQKALYIADIKGIQENMQDSVRNSVVRALEKIFCICANDKTRELEDVKTGIIKADKILKGQPHFLEIISDEVTQKVFKNARLNGANTLNRNGMNSFSIKVGKNLETGLIDMRVRDIMDENDREVAEKDFSYFDWSVMEAISSLYSYGIDKHKDNTGMVVLDLKAIDNMVKHGGTRIARGTVIEKTPLYESIKRLMGNHISISTEQGEFAGNLIEGEFDIVSGKVCLVVNEFPVLYEYALKTGGRKKVSITALNDLKLENVNYTTEHIGIYRYLIQRVREIYGSYKVDAEHSKAVATNSIPLNNIIEIFYPNLEKDFSDPRGKRRDIKNNVEKILEGMKGKSFIKNYKIIQREDNSITYELER